MQAKNIPRHLLELLEIEIPSIDWDIVPKRSYARAFYDKYHSDFTCTDTRAIDSIRDKIKFMTGNAGEENQALLSS